MVKKQKQYRFKSIFTLATLQFSGHFLEYFVQNSDKVVAFYLLSRLGNDKNFIEIYEKGKLVKKIYLFSPKNLLLRYFFLYIQYIWMLFTFFSPKEEFFFVNFNPFFFMGSSIVRLFRKVEYVYWIGDYWVMDSWIIKMYRSAIFFYHKRIPYTLYLTNRINKVMNKGTIRSDNRKKTVMWGVDSSIYTYGMHEKNTITLCFIGVLVETQGFELLLSVVKQSPNIRLKIIGKGSLVLVNKINDILKKDMLDTKVYFPNRFLYGNELKDIVNTCDIGIALYTVDRNNVTYFADPAKIKQYAEFGLPVIMTNVSEIASYISKYRAGIVVNSNRTSVQKAIVDIKKNYNLYKKGVQAFNNHFNYQSYYASAFSFMRKRL